MRVHAVSFATLVFCAATQAQSTPKPLPHHWLQIARLPPGSPILVHETYARTSTFCTLLWIDNTAVACDVYGERLVFPASEVESITPYNPPRHHAGVWIGMGAGAVVGAALGGSILGKSGVALGAMAGAAIVGSATLPK